MAGKRFEWRDNDEFVDVADADEAAVVAAAVELSANDVGDNEDEVDVERL